MARTGHGRVMRSLGSGRYIAIDATSRSEKVDRIFRPAIDFVREQSAEVARELKSANTKIVRR